MNLRARLATALAMFGVFATISIGALGYLDTASTLRDEVNGSLRSVATRLADPDGKTVAVLCVADEQPEAVAAQRSGDREDLEVLSDAPGISIQCLTTAGVVTDQAGPARPGPNQEKYQRLVVRQAAAALARTEEIRDHSYQVLDMVAPSGQRIRLVRDLGESSAVLRALRDRYIAAGAVVIALAALTGWLIARRETKRVMQLTNVTEQIAATGRLDIPMPPGGSDEVGRLAQSFSTMVGALSQSKEQQARLAQDAGHELRTPLTSLRTNIDTLRRHPNIADESRGAIFADLETEMRELATLIDELMALATDENDEEPDQDVRLDQIVERMAERTRRRWNRDVEVSAVETHVTGKPQLLLRAVGNLLENAAKFGPPERPIEVTVEDRMVRVRDYGPGLKAADLKRIFDRFYRASDARSYPGSGLGLAIVKHAMDVCGGHAKAENHPAGGAVFTLSFDH